MSEWNVTEHRPDPADSINAVATLGLLPMLDAVFGREQQEIYTVENSETHEVREITASNADDLGQKIADGDFDEDD